MKNSIIDRHVDIMMLEKEQEQKEKKESARKLIIDSCKDICEAVNRNNGQQLSDATRNLLTILDMVEVWR